MYLDLPPTQVERVVCSITAAKKYQIPANIMLAIAEQEGGNTGIKNKRKNENGSYDIGRMQFNTIYLKDLAKYGITEEDVAQPGCYSYILAAWRIRGHINNDAGDIWTKVSNYHSKTPQFNQIYRQQIIKKSQKWKVWLESRFSTFDINDTLIHGSEWTNVPPLINKSTSPGHEQLSGYASSLKELAVVEASASNNEQVVYGAINYNKPAADALAAVYGNRSLGTVKFKINE